TGGATLPATGPVTVGWSGTDLDGDALQYALSYSANNGSTWRLLVSTTKSSFTVDSSQLDGTGGAPTGVFRVVASDGVLSGQATSDHFAVASKPPTAVI